MTVLLHPLDQINAEWEALGSSLAAREALSALARAEPVLGTLAVGDLAGLVARARDPLGDPPGSAGPPGTVVRILLRSQSCHPLVPRAILQALLPGLVGVARQLAWGTGGDWESPGAFFADLFATAWEVVASWGGADRPYAAGDILSAVRCRLRRQILRRRDERRHVVPETFEEPFLANRSPTPFGAGPGGGLGTDGLERLAREIDHLWAHGLDPKDAAVAYGHHVLGLSIAEIARLTGRSRRHLDACRRRAELRLCT